MSDKFNFRDRLGKDTSPSRRQTADEMEWDVDSSSRNSGHTDAQSDDYSSNIPAMPLFNEEPENANSDNQPDFRRYLAGIWQRRWLVLLTSMLITSVILILIIFAVDRHWQASTTLIKRSHQDRLSLAERDPFKSQDYNLATLLDTLKLPSSLEQVRKQAGLNVSVTSLATAIDVSLGRDSKIINLKATWGDPVMAAKIANLVADTFIERTRGMLREDAKTAYEYYRAQLDEARVQARKLSAEVHTFKQANGISDLSAETKVLLEEMSRMQGEYNSKLAEADAMREASLRIEEAVKEEPEQVITYTIFRSPLKSRLADYEWELRDALSKYTVENPKVIKLKQRIGALKQMIKQNKDQAVPENTYTPNTKLEEMNLRLQQLADDIKMREAQAGALRSTLNDMNEKLAALSAQDKEFMLLQSHLDGMLNLENQLSQRVEETRLAMQRNDASFDIVERAAPPPEPQSSGRKLLAVAGLFLGVAGGLILALLLELRDPYLRSRRELMGITESTTCLEIPRSDNGDCGLIDFDNPISELANLYRRLINDIDAAAGSSAHTPLGVVSVDPATGRSLVAANLALTRAIKGQSSLLVDADLRSNAGKRATSRLGVSADHRGLYENLVLNQPLEIIYGEEGKPDVITAGSTIPDNRGLLSLAQHQLPALARASARDRFTIIDLPPLAGFELAYESAQQIGRTIIVARCGYTRRDELKHCKAQLEKRGIECVASILLDVPIGRLESAAQLSQSEYHQNNTFQGVTTHA